MDSEACGVLSELFKKLNNNVLDKEINLIEAKSLARILRAVQIVKLK